MFTHQQTFDTVVAHLRTQKRKAKATNDEGGEVCVYRAPNGDRCAAGCLIPDDKYRPSLEGLKANSTTAVGTVLREVGHDVALVAELQWIHDSQEPTSWERGFREIAQTFSINYTPPEAHL